LTLCNPLFLKRSVQLIFSFLFQRLIWKLSVYF
jgi:hypothetical protein